MKRAIGAVLLASLLASCASGSSDPRERFYRSLAPRANPSAVIATELAFAREAREEGQWTAFREFAAEDAVMFVPEAVEARAWLANRADPPQPVQWQPHQVWSSCDGSLSVTRGAWQGADGSSGYFTTVWRREGRRGDEEYRWVLDQGDTLAEPLAEPDIIRTTVADCGGDALPVAAAAGAGATAGSGSSRDRTLTYAWDVAPDLSRTITVTMLIDGEAEDVLTVAVAAPGGG
ncbi:hypothetical protein [Altererythrobacter sp. C41]|uniref:hypothetical protein n=1 Tax=Altererythrobacter sp. C41 TaxID=2806021 RepID=UPI0019323488|nr:hypothetical protein [Altererythrobacter sp. C41]MBM0169460.1 hypothetical protein [Altererythrobacter sp. C41]